MSAHPQGTYRYQGEPLSWFPGETRTDSRMKKPTVLLVHGDEDFRRGVRLLVAARGGDLIEPAQRGGVRRAARDARADLVIVGPSPAGGELETVRQIRAGDRRVPLILSPHASSEALAIAALKAGVTDYLKPPVSPGALAEAIGSWLAGPPGAEAGVEAWPELRDSDLMIADSPAMQRIKRYIGKAAATDSTVLITGETGTGKELVAALVHRNSARRDKPFVSINCAAIPETLLESEMFGYERGAFTGAHALKEGKLKLADQGTVFFDEIGDMSLHAQAKILRAIESREVHRLGGRAGVPVDVRFIAATNQDLEALIGEGRFRKDLYFRLNVARIHLPPLRERKDDLPRLFDHYVREFNRRFGRDVEGFVEDILERLLGYDWPGNVRELKNVLEATFVNAPAGRISGADLPEQFSARLGLSGTVPDERDRLLVALVSSNWNKSKAAQKLRWSRMTVYRKIARYHLRRSERPPDATPGRTTPPPAPPTDFRCSPRP